MRWQHKALIQKTLASVPGGEPLYRLIQKKFGTLDADPWFRLPHCVAMLDLMQKVGFSPQGKTFMEVGTGHKPIIPLAFYLAGVDKVVTVDLNRRLDYRIVMDMLGLMKRDAAKIRDSFATVVPSEVLESRLQTLMGFRGSLEQALELFRIEYLAPGDAARMDWAAESIDCHFSTTTLEHIPLPVLKDIFTEAHRLMHKDAVAIHLIDPSDHYQHQDAGITKINFLKYSDYEWQNIAGNQFGYTNRLRASQFIRLFEDTGFESIQEEADVDTESLQALKSGFRPDNAFSGFEPEDLCTTSLRVVLRKKRR